MAKNGKNDKNDSSCPYIGILLVSHGSLSSHFLEAAQLIYQQDLGAIATVAIGNKLSREQVGSLVDKAISKQAKRTDKIIILFDTPGSTCSKLVGKMNYPSLQIRCVYGMNLPMLLDAVHLRDDCDLDRLADRLCTAGRDAIYSRVAGDADAA